MLPLPLTPWEVGLILVLGFILSKTSVEGIKHYGVKMGDLTTLSHGLRGEVYAADGRHIILKEFIYDGGGPDAFFWVGTSDEPDSNGFIVPFPRKQTTPIKLKRFDKEVVMLELPEKYYITDNIKYFCVWCRKFQANFGMVKILSTFISKLPKERENIGRLKTLNHTEVSGDITILDSKIIRIPEFIFDWKSDKKTHFMIAKEKNESTYPGAFKAHVKKDGIYTPAPLDEYTGKDTVYVKLPGDLEIQEFDVLIVNCPECPKNEQIYGLLKIPTNLLDGIPIPANVDEKQLESEPGSTSSTQLNSTSSTQLDPTSSTHLDSTSSSQLSSTSSTELNSASQANILKNIFIIIATMFLKLQFYI